MPIANTQLYKNKDLLPNADWGKSRTKYSDPAATTNRSRQIKLNGVSANVDFLLPANCRVHGDIVILHNGTVNQAAVTIGTSAAGTQVSAGAVTNFGTTAILAATDTGVSRSDRRLYVASAAWQAKVDIVLNVTEYPPVADTSAKS